MSFGAHVLAKLDQRGEYASAGLPQVTEADHPKMLLLKEAGTRDTLETRRDLAGASLNQLIAALGETVVRNAYVSGDQTLIAMAMAAILERELSSDIPRDWRIKQALNALLKMGPHATAALATMLEHPSARVHISNTFSH